MLCLLLLKTYQFHIGIKNKCACAFGFMAVIADVCELPLLFQVAAAQLTAASKSKYYEKLDL